MDWPGGHSGAGQVFSELTPVDPTKLARTPSAVDRYWPSATLSEFEADPKRAMTIEEVATATRLNFNDHTWPTQPSGTKLSSELGSTLRMYTP